MKVEICPTHIESKCSKSFFFLRRWFAGISRLSRDMPRITGRISAERETAQVCEVSSVMAFTEEHHSSLLFFWARRAGFNTGGYLIWELLSKEHPRIAAHEAEISCELPDVCFAFGFCFAWLLWVFLSWQDLGNIQKDNVLIPLLLQQIIWVGSLGGVILCRDMHKTKGVLVTKWHLFISRGNLSVFVEFLWNSYMQRRAANSFLNLTEFWSTFRVLN